jgi:tetratricopeptide (TPR) repeat protein
MRQKHNNFKYLFLMLLAGLSLFAKVGIGKQRGFRPGDKIPEFSSVDIAGNVYNYKNAGKKAMMITFLSAGQKNSIRAASDIKEVIEDLGKDAELLEVVIVVEDPDSVYLQSEEIKLVKNFKIFIDSEFHLWGKFGIIATPTVIISDANDIITRVRAGHGYDFIPDMRNHLNQALGLAKVSKQEKEIQVRTVTNDTVSAKVKRHLQMAKMLLEKGEYKPAKVEILKAREMDPNSIEIKLQLTELLCRTNQSQAALSEIEKIETTSGREKARILLLSGWANRQMGKLDPKSIRTLFELGRVYQAGGQTEKAMKLYYEALAIILGEREAVQKSQ